jgi:hypothetical protein
MNREIMQQALDALQIYSTASHKIQDAIKALKAELSKPERWFQQFGDAPPRKEWAGLTNNEIDTYAQQNSFSPDKAPKWFTEVCRDIESRLKELNT